MMSTMQVALMLQVSLSTDTMTGMRLDENAYIVMATKWSNNRYIMLLHIITLVICAKYNSTNLLSEDILTQNRT